MIKHESEFGDEIATAIGNTHTIKTVTSSSTPQTTPAVATSTPVLKATTTPIIATGTPKVIKTSTTTPTNSTSTVATTAIIPDAPSTDYVFTDVTISNQNMRVGTSVYGTVVYAFIGTQTLVISPSTDGILSLRAKVLQK